MDTVEIVLEETLDHRGQNILVQAKMGQRHTKTCPPQVGSGKKDRDKIFSPKKHRRGTREWTSASNSVICG
jgi:hypothetical protein